MNKRDMSQQSCVICKKWRTIKCCERKQTGRDSFPGDWCFGFKKKTPVKNDGALRHVAVPSPPGGAATTGIYLEVFR